MAKRRPSGDGMVHKREDGRWEGRIVVGHKKNGTPIFQHAGGVAGIVENDGFGLRRNGGPEAGLIHSPALLGIGGDLHAYAAGQFDLIAVEGKIGGEDNDLIAGVQNGHHDQRHAKAARGGDQNMIRR